jgi:amino acid adenylation domain-containing protein
VGLLGILKAGGAYVPLDPKYPKERLAFMLEDSHATVLLTEDGLLRNFPEYSGQTVCLNGDSPSLTQEKAENPDREVTFQHIAYVIYTSGSTGVPKGTMIEHRSLVNYLCWITADLFGAVVQNLPLITSLSFDASLKQLFAPLLNGKDVWILSGEAISQPAMLLAELGTRIGVGLNCVPSLWKVILDHTQSGRIVSTAENFSSLFLGGEQISEELLDRTIDTLPDVAIWNLYGLTEATANSVFCRIVSGCARTIGRPTANTQIYILDSHLQPVPIGVSGEIHIGGDGLARAYLNRPELSAERFICNPFSAVPGARLYKTGDLGRYLPDGTIELLGRIDDQVKIRGFRIELGEVEIALLQHPGVKETVVLAREDILPDDIENRKPKIKNPKSDRRLVAYVVPANKQSYPTAELRNFLKQKLPDYMVPSAFVFLDSFPLTFSGKIDQKALPAPDRRRPELEEIYVAPRTPLEEMIAEIWAEVLKLPKVGVHDNFFELGGHSLLATQLVSRVRERLLVELPLRVLFENATVAGLSEHIETIRSIKRQDQGAVRELSGEREEIRM